MSEFQTYQQFTEKALAGELLDSETSLRILRDPELEVLPLVNAAFAVRKKYWQKIVTVHIINNAQNGHCPEDCAYCAQAKTSSADIEDYPLKSEDETLKEAKAAYESGAHRYCMVYAGRGLSEQRTRKLANLIKKIKSQYPLEICVSAGLVNQANAMTLKAAGLDRLNHNLNTSENHYPSICSTHTYQDRLNTLQAARDAGLQVCSGMIAGMGEKPEDVLKVAMQLRELKAESIPVNFLVPIEGNRLKDPQGLSPEYCLRILCLFRFLNPQSEIRVAAGREGHLRSLEVMSLYPANSLFLEGYLNTKGSSRLRTLKMIKDAGFTIQSNQSIEEILKKELNSPETFEVDENAGFMKDLADLRPYLPQS